MKKVIKRKLKKQTIFNLVSIIIILSVGFYYLGRLIYFKINSEREIEYSDIFYKRIIEQNDTYELRNQLVNTNGIYRFIGNVDNNYVKYKGYLWRIIRINKDQSVTMITEDSVSFLAYGASLQTIILPWLNKTDDNIATGLFETGLEQIDNQLIPNRICLDTFSDIEIAGCYDNNTDYKIGLLSVDDYIKAGDKDSYLNNEQNYWTTNRYDASKAWYVSSDGLLGNTEDSSKYGIRPVITINGSLTDISGEGTSENPYLIVDRDIQKVSDIYVGSYLIFNDEVWKVISKNNDNVKIASTECLKGEDGECLESIFSNTNNSINLNAKNDLIYYLNNTYYNSLLNKEAVVDGPFYTGTYSLSTNDYRTVINQSVNLKIGLLAMAEPFAFDLPNTFLLTTRDGNTDSIYSVNESQALFETLITQKLNIRPALYLNGNLTIKGGNGSYLEPYELEKQE